MADSPTLSGRDRPVGASDSAPSEETIQGVGGRGVFVPTGMTGEEIMVGAGVLETRFDVAPYISRSMVREILSAVRAAKPSC